MRRGIRLAPLLALSAWLRAAAPLPEMAVPRTAHPPVIDGKISPGEWDRAAACSGFVKAFDGGPAHVQSIAWITFDSRYIYVAFKNYRGARLSFLSASARRADDERIVNDPANEVWISPPASPAVTFQSIFNVYPAVLDVKMIPSLGNSSKAWSGKWEVASSQTADSWTVEARAPIAAFGPAAIANGETWRALFATDILSDPDKFRAWAPGGAFADIPRHGFLHFTYDGPAFQLLDMESVFTGKAALAVAAVQGLHTRSSIQVTARFGAALDSRPGDINITRTVSPAAGATEPFTLTADLASLAKGFCEITASDGGAVLYHQTFPFTADGFVRRAPAALKTTPYDQPFGLEASYAPLSKKLLVKIDRYYMPRRGAVAGGRIELTDPRTGKIVAARAAAAFLEDYSEFPVDLKELQPPVETQQDWDRAKRKEAPPTAAAEYRLKAVLTARDGSEIAAATIPVKLLGYQFEWLPNQIGISDRAIPPWTPVTRSGSTVSLWNKQYAMNGAGLAEKLTNGGAAQLTGPMRLEAVVSGRKSDLESDAIAAGKQSEAAIEFSGGAHAGAVRVQVRTRVEFDGFVWNEMTVAPTQANLERLSLVVDMPEREAPFFVTTSGSWSSYYGATPERWDSRESSLTGLTGNFVPYILLTDSERGFSWFADNERGWRLDPALPTQQVSRHDGLVTLRVDFVNRPGPVAQPISIRYGWMATPQKPQPKGWRGYLIDFGKYFPQATPLFWNEADWAVSWPYYSSPFPKDYEKSRKLLAASADKGTVGCVGNIAHAIARYVDYQGRDFAAVAGDWGAVPGDRQDGNVARSRGPNDFQLFHFDRWARLSGLSCLYFDENYLSEDRNYLTGGAYLLPDERVQPGYDFLGLREYNKRLRYMFHANGMAPPNLWQHTTGQHPVYAWMPDVSMEAENVEPADLKDDYMEALPAGRLRSIGMGRNLGSAPFVMDQNSRHFKGPVSQFLSDQLVGWVLAHDILPEGTAFWPVLSSELELWRDDVRFLPYWSPGLGVASLTAGVEVSAHARPGNAVLWIVNQRREDVNARVRLDWKKLGFTTAAAPRAYDAETGDPYPVENDSIQVSVPKRMWRAVRLFQPSALQGDMTFVAHFDSEAAADEAFGGRYPLGKSLPPLIAGKDGRALALDQPVAFLARQHVTPLERKDFVLLRFLFA